MQVQIQVKVVCLPAAVVPPTILQVLCMLGDIHGLMGHTWHPIQDLHQQSEKAVQVQVLVKVTHLPATVVPPAVLQVLCMLGDIHDLMGRTWHPIQDLHQQSEKVAQVQVLVNVVHPPVTVVPPAVLQVSCMLGDICGVMGRTWHPIHGLHQENHSSSFSCSSSSSWL